MPGGRGEGAADAALAADGKRKLGTRLPAAREKRVPINSRARAIFVPSVSRFFFFLCLHLGPRPLRSFNFIRFLFFYFPSPFPAPRFSHFPAITGPTTVKSSRKILVTLELLIAIFLITIVARPRALSLL